ncbi:hypothetical protein [Pseudoduganella namucuonensis]|uniref:ApeA N-terminal domain-containing protein n=1 Tax=Pseudoduganella namucuonensis TaxID=1035707 RepID=A0A1I7I3N9_9BURK|nr:hypothetical protein [Pseudoduganella namucuonensis]SFU67528.1 hypothetical protein SAMN05216552_100768 [Pseudoduganella namucuonensis]
MALLWRLNRELVFADGSNAAIAWPALLVMRIKLTPADFFGVSEEGAALTTVSTSAEMEINGITGQLRIINSPLLTEASLLVSFLDGPFSLTGNEVELEARVTSLAHFQSTVNWISDRLTSFLSVHSGVFHEITELDGELAGQKFSAMYPAASYSVAFAQVTEEERIGAIRSALGAPKQDQGSYARYVAACHYFQQAVRLVSPQQVKFSPYAVHAEVLLNLCKSIEALISPTSRDDLRKKFRALGFNDKQIESQIIPISLIRNEIDVGHAALNPAVCSEISTLRSFVDRSIQNVATILRVVGARIAAGEELLIPLVEQTSDSRLKLVKRLAAYLAKPSLDPVKQQPHIASTT